jgi:hypothetical protein
LHIITISTYAEAELEKDLAPVEAVKVYQEPPATLMLEPADSLNSGPY